MNTLKIMLFAETKENGKAMIAEQVELIPNKKARRIAKEHLVEMGEGKRDFRF